MGTQVPYRITPCYLPPSRGDIPTFFPVRADTWSSDPRGMQDGVDPCSVKVNRPDVKHAANNWKYSALPLNHCVSIVPVHLDFLVVSTYKLPVLEAADVCSLCLEWCMAQWYLRYICVNRISITDTRTLIFPIFTGKKMEVVVYSTTCCKETRGTMARMTCRWSLCDSRITRTAVVKPSTFWSLVQCAVHNTTMY